MFADVCWRECVRTCGRDGDKCVRVCTYVRRCIVCVCLYVWVCGCACVRVRVCVGEGGGASGNVLFVCEGVCF